MALASVTETLFAPEFDKATAPVKSLLELVNVVALAPAAKLEVQQY